MFNLANIFGGSKAPQPQLSPAQGANPQLAAQVAAAAAPGTPGNIPATNNMPANPANPTVPLNGNTPADANTPAGLDKFNKLWEPVPEDQQRKEPVSAFAGITPEAVANHAGKIDFTKVVTPEMMAKISAGGEEGIATMMVAMNKVAQQSYGESAQASMQLVEVALAKQREDFESRLPDLIRNQNVNNNLRNTNPIFNHPAAAPVLASLTEQIQRKNPTATAEQVQTQAQEWLLSLATAATPAQQPSQAAKAKSASTDFSDWV